MVKASDIFGPLIMGGILSGLGILFYSLHQSSIKNEEERERAYQQSQEQIRGEVIEERYENTLESVPEKHMSGFLSQAYSNETVKVESTYTLRVRTDDGRELGVSVFDGPNAKKESLDVLLDEGSRISFPRGNLEKYKYHASDKRIRQGPIHNEKWFTPSTKFGNKRADRITLID